uniref:Uncharacterized protein n=1 Tax=Palpitomonas bilix TaxID=652834 RepID=A0A7S3G7G8_9EUKA|mmetsp:Transcript_33024/g.85089  ORF Transcript_33024/g.85089 Transcript_33024/m.85089 type:complete len:325 (+) Transcript_33024:46-1020(+)
MKPFVVVVLLGFALSATALRSEEEYAGLFKSYVRQFAKRYDVTEFIDRYNVFKANLDKIETFMARKDRDVDLAVNEFADLTQDEFKKAYLGFQLKSIPTKGAPKVNSNPSNDIDIDWRKKGAVTPVKNQGQCGSCWSFSTTGSIEGAYAIKTGDLVSFSEQQLVDCSGSYGNNGCNGGLMDNAFQYVEKYGLEKESDYPYTAQDGSCQYDASKVVAGSKVSSYTDAAQNAQSVMDLLQKGPVSVAIEADQFAFQFYSSGVLTGACGTNLDHGVLVVGAGSDNGQDFWILKNSWSASWGEAGYIRIARGDSDECGVNLSASQPYV